MLDQVKRLLLTQTEVLTVVGAENVSDVKGLLLTQMEALTVVGAEKGLWHSLYGLNGTACAGLEYPYKECVGLSRTVYIHRI